METKNIKQTVIFKAKPEEVYNLYMDAEKHSAFTGGKAIMPKRAGCKYSNYDGYITGKIIHRP